MGEKSQRLENEPHKKFNFFLISVGQSGNKDVPILRAPSQDSYVHMCTQTHTTYAIPNTCLNMYKGMTVLSPPGSFDSIPVLSPCLHLQHFQKIDGPPPLSQEKGIFLQRMSWEVGAGYASPTTTNLRRHRQHPLNAFLRSQRLISLSLLVLSPVHSSCWLLRLYPSHLQTKANGC